MKKFFVFAFFGYVGTAYALCSAAPTHESTKLPIKLRIEKHEAALVLVVKYRGSDQTINLINPVEDINKIVVRDFNLDGKDDLGIPGDEGNVARYLDIYTYSSITRKFERNVALSELPCISVNERSRTVSGECFHTSACENWAETYKFRADDSLDLVRKKGFYCDPSTGKSYKYISIFSGGKLLKNTIHQIEGAKKTGE